MEVLDFKEVHMEVIKEVPDFKEVHPKISKKVPACKFHMDSRVHR